LHDREERERALSEEIERLRERIRALEGEIAVRDERDAYLDACLRAAGARLFVQDRDLRYTHVRNHADGFSPDDVIGRTDDDFFPSGDAAVLRAVKQSVLRTGRPAREEVVIRFGGETIAVDLAASPLREEDGTIRGIACASWDVTESRRTREAHLVNEERLRHLTDLAFEGIAIHRGGDLLFVNRTFAELLRRERAELIGADVLRFVAPESRETVRRMIDEGDETPYEARILLPDGERCLCEIAGRPVDYYGEEARFASFREVTENRRAEQKTVRAAGDRLDIVES